MVQDLTPQNLRLSIHPGEWYFGHEYTSLHTILGSCVALSTWHPALKLGGLCHYLLPAPPEHKKESSLLQDDGAGRYGKTALLLMKQSMECYAPLSEYQLGLFGGCDTIANGDIGQQNALYGQRWLKDLNLNAIQVDVGGNRSRSLVFDIVSGVITLKHYATQISDLPTQ
jgi:chemotaxis protein CheD